MKDVIGKCVRPRNADSEIIGLTIPYLPALPRDFMHSQLSRTAGVRSRLTQIFDKSSLKYICSVNIIILLSLLNVID